MGIVWAAVKPFLTPILGVAAIALTVALVYSRVEIGALEVQIGMLGKASEKHQKDHADCLQTLAQVRVAYSELADVSNKQSAIIDKMQADGMLAKAEAAKLLADARQSAQRYRDEAERLRRAEEAKDSRTCEQALAVIRQGLSDQP